MDQCRHLKQLNRCIYALNKQRKKRFQNYFGTCDVRFKLSKKPDNFEKNELKGKKVDQEETC